MRIIGGKYKGRNLTGPSDFRVRPTSELVRGALLDLLAADLPDADVLDLFAGTGALGLEALSRGAKRCDFVETRPSSLHALKANIALLRMRDRVRVFKRDALPFAANLGEKSYDLVFVDPPYESRMLDRVIESWQRTKFTPVLAVEHASVHELPAGGVVHQVFGESAITIYRLPPAAPIDAAPE